MSDDLREGDEDFHKPKSTVVILTWEETRRIVTTEIAHDMQRRPEHWLSDFQTRDLAQELARRGFTYVNTLGEPKNVRSN